MAKLELRRWEGNTAGLARLDRSPCSYEVYVLDALVAHAYGLTEDELRCIFTDLTETSVSAGLDKGALYVGT